MKIISAFLLVTFGLIGCASTEQNNELINHKKIAQLPERESLSYENNEKSNIDSAELLSLMGKTALENGDHDKAISYLRKSADQGNEEAHVLLGAMYYLGEGVSQDYAKAAFWYRNESPRVLWRLFGLSNTGRIRVG